MNILYSTLLLFITTLTFSQNTVTGKIVDIYNDPIAEANIYIPSIEKGIYTSQDGEFEIITPSTGTYQLVISSMGYATKTLKITLPLDEPLNIILQTSAIEMEAVIVSTPFHKLQSENVVKVERATLEDLNRSGARNLADGITQLPGVESITTGAGIGKPVIRGLSSNRVLVYTQGVRLENQQFGDEHGLGVSGSGVESVEVIKGPASLLYGSDALGGVLYLNPEKYALNNSSMFDAKVSYQTNTLGLETNAGYKASGDNFKFLLRANRAIQSDYKTGEGDRVTNSRFKELDLKSGIAYQVEDYKADIRYNYNNTDTGIPEEIGMQSTSTTPLEPFQEVSNHILSFDNTFQFNNSNLNLKLGYLFNDRKEFEDHHEEELLPIDLAEEDEDHDPALEMHLETLNYDLKYTTPKWGKFETIFGAQGMYQTNQNFGEEILIPNASIKDFGMLATTHLHLEKLDVQAGLRFDKRWLDSENHGSPQEENYFQALNREFTSYNGALGFKYNILNNLITRFNAATGFRAPNLAELTSNGSHEGANRYEVGNPDLDNEQNFQLDLALELRNEHFEIFANAFYNKINNYIFLDPTDQIEDDKVVFNYNQENARLFGGEAGIHIHPHPLDWLHLESSIEIVKGEKEDGEFLPLIPATSITNTLRMEFEEKFFFLTYKNTLAQNDVSEFETITNGYNLLSAGIGGKYTIGKANVNINVSGSNLLNETYIAHLSRLKSDGIPNIGRNIILSLQTSF